MPGALGAGIEVGGGTELALRGSRPAMMVGRAEAGTAGAERLVGAAAGAGGLAAAGVGPGAEPGETSVPSAGAGGSGLAALAASACTQ